jgi:dihydrofolate reductase
VKPTVGILTYAAITSLDGFVEDEHGRFDWAVPDAVLHTYINGLEAGIGTHLYGRRMYETMAVWQDLGTDADAEPAEVEYAELWRGLDKIVYSTTLDDVWTPRTHLRRHFDAAEVAELKQRSDRDLSVSGPHLARHAFAAGLVDDVHLFLFPIVVGGGKPGLPRAVHLDLDLVDVRRFDTGVVHLHLQTVR